MFVYHRKPDNMTGTVLYPLNALQHLLPEIYAAQKLKYVGREQVMDETVQLLDCRWNDVLHLSPLHPYFIYQGLTAAGLDVDPNRQYFKIPVQQLSEEKTVIYIFESNDIVPGDNQFLPFSRKEFRNLTALPEKTQDYYRNRVAQSQQPLIFAYVPHIMTMNTVETKNCDVICWSDPLTNV